MHESTHKDMVLSGVQSLMLLALIRVKQRVVKWVNSVFASVCIALLCRFVLRLFMCLIINAT